MGEAGAKRLRGERALGSQVCSERVGHFSIETSHGSDRLEYTEYGAGDAWVVLLPPMLVPRRVHDHVARTLASAGLHVLTLDPLGHGGSDRPADPMAYSVTAFGRQVVALLDEVGAAQAVIGGSSLGANIALEVAVTSPDRVCGLLLDGPVLDNALAVQLAVLAPVMYAARFVPLAVTAVRIATRPVPRGPLPAWLRLALETLDQESGPLASMVHGVLFGRFAPDTEERQRIAVPTLALARVRDPFHPKADAAMVAREIDGAVLEQANAALEWRRRPERLDLVVTRFALDAAKPRRPRRTAR